jgi:glutamate 5-kinase
MKFVVKIGTSSLTGRHSYINYDVLKNIATQCCYLANNGHRVVIVSSGAIGIALKKDKLDRRKIQDISELQAYAAYGQIWLMQAYLNEFQKYDLKIGQVLLDPIDFVQRTQYLKAKNTILKLLELTIIPVINENDAVTDEEIRFGDNDRLAALVAIGIEADLLVMLTDAPGVLTSDPRFNKNATLIKEIEEIDKEIEKATAKPGTPFGSGGIASKLAAAKMATWAGIDVLIGDSKSADILIRAANADFSRASYVKKQENKMAARKLWIAFATKKCGDIVIDDGAKKALMNAKSSLLSVGIKSVTGNFNRNDAVEIKDCDSKVIAKGLTRMSCNELDALLKTNAENSRIVVHRNDLVLI